MRSVLLLVGFLALPVQAAPIAEARTDGVRVVLHNDPCVLDAVANLSRRAQWFEAGRIFEGCWGSSRFGIVMFYWSDRTVVAIPKSAFTDIIDL